MNKHKLNKGFTLIELLVVIAIIGILSSVVLASLNSARNSGKEAGILSSLKNISTQAEIYRTTEGTYQGLCSDPKIQEMVGALDDARCSVNAGDSNELYKIDYGVIASANDTYYGADPRGVYTFDADDEGSSIQWANACTAAGKRLPGPSTLKAKHELDGAAGGFYAFGNYWSYLESPSDSFEAYYLEFDAGKFYSSNKTNTFNVRCVH